MSKAADFTAWLKAQEGAAYVWGAQGQQAASDGALYLDNRRVCPSWEAWVNARETTPDNALRARVFIKKRLSEGNARVSLFDCSGLVMRHLQTLKGYFPADKNAQGLLDACREADMDALKSGALLFRHNGKRATHVGVFLGADRVIEAQGRDAGVVIRSRAASGESYWNRCGTLPCLEEAKARFAVCAGGSVHVRSAPGTEHAAICIARKGDRLLAAASHQPDWEQVALEFAGRLVTGYMHKKYITDLKEGMEQ